MGGVSVAGAGVRAFSADGFTAVRGACFVAVARWAAFRAGLVAVRSAFFASRSAVLRTSRVGAFVALTA